MIKAVIFDMDGVLVDSLKAHLNYCHRLANEVNDLNISIPSEDDFKTKIARNQAKTISPMEEFFKAVGFPEDEAQQADESYQKDFFENPNGDMRLFPHVPEMLRLLHSHGLKLGLVTSNIQSNVSTSLEECFKLFDANYVLTKDDDGTKCEKIKRVVGNMHLEPGQVVYVGDQSSDAKAAEDAGVGFLGVTWGWEISSEDHKKYFIVQEMSDLILTLMNSYASPSIDELKTMLEHGQSLFTYHAAQRHASIRFYFISLSIMVVGYSSVFTSEHQLFWVGVPLGVVGTVIAVFFWLLDTRNEELVDCDEDFLKVAQDRIAQRFYIPKFKMIEASDGKGYWFISYRFLMPCLFYFFILLNLIGIYMSYNVQTFKSCGGNLLSKTVVWLNHPPVIHCFGSTGTEILFSALILFVAGFYCIWYFKIRH